MLSRSLARRCASLAMLAPMFLGSLYAQGIKESPPSPSITENSAKRGDIFTGIVYSKSKNELILDTTPCKTFPEKIFKAFAAPFVTTDAKEKQVCGKETYKLVLVEKK